MADITLKGAFQDGGTFYRDELLPTSRDDVIASYPEMVVGDHDTAGAERARLRFASEHPEFVAFTTLDADVLASSRARIQAAHDRIAVTEARLFASTDEARRTRLGAILLDAQVELGRACRAQAVLLGHSAP